MLFKPEKNVSTRSKVVWNIFSGVIASLEAVIMTMVTTRIIDIEASGEITIAFALGNLFRTIGLWGTRTFHVSDQKKEYTFLDYIKARFFSIFLMFEIVFIYLAYAYFVQNVSFQKLVAILVIDVIFGIECYEDALWGEYQRHGRIDIGAKLFFIRWASFLITYIFSLYLFRSIIPALIVSLFISFILFLLMVRIGLGISLSKIFEDKNIFLSVKQRDLMKKTFPLFLVTFFAFFLNNVAKYSLDQYYNDSIQACFGFITLPTFAVEMISGFIYQPKLANISALWQENKIKRFFLEVLIQTLYIITITIVCSVGAWFIGIPVLSMVFATNLSAYHIDLVINIISGGTLALALYASAILTIMRKQKLQLYIYGVTALIGGFFIWMLARFLGIRGGSIGNLLVFALQSFAIYILVIIFIYKREKFELE